MTWTYELDTAVGGCRLLINDRFEETAQYSDEEIQYALDAHEGDVYEASADLLEAWAIHLALTAHNVDLGDYKEDTTAAAREMRMAAQRLRLVAGGSPAFAVSNKAWDGALGYVGHDIRLNKALTGDW